MKKLKILFIVILCLFIATGCENAKMNATDTDTDTTVDESAQYDSEYYEVIGLEKFKEVYASSTPTIIYFGASWCENCEAFKSYAKQFARDNKIKVYFVQIDADDFTTEDQTELATLVTFEYIPFITVFKNKEKVYGEAGLQTVENLVELASKYGVTK